jgi:hypothetical protein
MRRVSLAAAALFVTACGTSVPLTPDLRAGGDLSAMPLRVLGTFELRAAGRTSIVVRNETTPLSAEARDDSTIVLQVLGPQLAGGYDTLALTFKPSMAAQGAYTLRQVNGTVIGRSISIGGTNYQYVPCYQNVGSKCLQPISEGAQEDSQVRIGLRR